MMPSMDGTSQCILVLFWCAEATRVTSINSCLCVVGCLDGSSITTVEGMGNSTAGFHRVQGALLPCTSITSTM